MAITKGSKVRVTNYCGRTEEPHTEKKYQLIGQEGYVQTVRTAGYFEVVLPQNLHYATGRGALLNASEIELVETHTP